MNIVILNGRIGKNPEQRGAGKTPVTSFSMVTSRPKRDSEGQILKDKDGYTMTDDEWHRITCFNGLGKSVMANAFKGQKVLVRGRIHYGQYEDEGTTKYTVEIIADEVEFLEWRQKDGNDKGGNVDVD
jgi:single-strand DNA-binding protein